jgi:hypothetical protein
VLLIGAPVIPIECVEDLGAVFIMPSTFYKLWLVISHPFHFVFLSVHTTLIHIVSVCWSIGRWIFSIF